MKAERKSMQRKAVSLCVIYTAAKGKSPSVLTFPERWAEAATGRVSVGPQEGATGFKAGSHQSWTAYGG